MRIKKYKTKYKKFAINVRSNLQPWHIVKINPVKIVISTVFNRNLKRQLNLN